MIWGVFVALKVFLLGTVFIDFWCLPLGGQPEKLSMKSWQHERQKMKLPTRKEESVFQVK